MSQYPPPPYAAPGAPSPWATTALATLLSFAINTVTAVVATVVAVVGFFVLGVDLSGLEPAEVEEAFGEDATQGDVERWFEELFSDASWGGYLLLLLGLLLLCTLVLLVSVWVVARFLRRRGVPRATLASWLGALANVVVGVLGFLVVGPFVVVFSYAAMWAVMALVAQSAAPTALPRP